MYIFDISFSASKNQFMLLFDTVKHSFAGVCPREIHSKAGEMVALYCPRNRGYNHADTKLVWTSHTTQRTYVTNNMSSDELTQMGVVLHGRSLVILSVSINHQGNYSCAMG